MKIFYKKMKGRAPPAQKLRVGAELMDQAGDDKTTMVVSARATT
jgi:hypothetical protein